MASAKADDVRGDTSIKINLSSSLVKLFSVVCLCCFGLIFVALFIDTIMVSANIIDTKERLLTNQDFHEIVAATIILVGGFVGSIVLHLFYRETDKGVFQVLFEKFIWKIQGHKKSKSNNEGN